MDKLKKFSVLLVKYFIPFMLLNETVFVFIFGREFRYLRIGIFGIFVLLYFVLRFIGDFNKPLKKRDYIFFILISVNILINFSNKVDRRLLAYAYAIVIWLLFYLNSELIFGSKFDSKRLISLFAPFIFCSMILSTVALGMYLKKIGYWDEKLKYFIGYRTGLDYGTGKEVKILYGLYLDTNHASVFSLFSCILSLFICLKSQSNIIFKAINALNIGIQMEYIVLAKSRGVLVTIVAIFFLYAVAYALWKYKEKKKITALSILAILVIIILVGVKIYKRITVKGFSSTRLLIWNEGLNVLFENFFFGVGINRLADYALMNPLKYPILSWNKALHNSYLDLFVAYGAIIGFFVGIKLIKDFVTLAHQTYLKQKDVIYLTLFLELAIPAFFLSCLFLGLNLMNVIFAIVCGIMRIKIKSKENKIFSGQG